MVGFKGFSALALLVNGFSALGFYVSPVVRDLEHGCRTLQLDNTTKGVIALFMPVMRCSGRLFAFFVFLLYGSLVFWI